MLEIVENVQVGFANLKKRERVLAMKKWEEMTTEEQSALLAEDTWFAVVFGWDRLTEEQQEELIMNNPFNVVSYCWDRLSQEQRQMILNERYLYATLVWDRLFLSEQEILLEKIPVNCVQECWDRMTKSQRQELIKRDPNAIRGNVLNRLTLEEKKLITELYNGIFPTSLAPGPWS